MGRQSYLPDTTAMVGSMSETVSCKDSSCALEHKAIDGCRKRASEPALDSMLFGILAANGRTSWCAQQFQKQTYSRLIPCWLPRIAYAPSEGPGGDLKVEDAGCSGMRDSAHMLPANCLSVSP